jgi:phosphonate transport system permease protein
MPSASDAPRPSSAVLTFEAARAELARQRRLSAWLGTALFGAALAFSVVVGEFSPAKLAEGLPRIGEYVERTLPELRLQTFAADMAQWYYGLGRWLRLLGETVLMAYLATLLGTLGAFVLCFPAARNLTPHSAVYFVSRRALEFARAVPDLVYALIFIFAFGLGPLAGVLAVAVHSLGASGKLFAEACENADWRPVEGVRSAGANWFETIRYAIVPQVLPDFASYTLWRFEINVRASAIIGFVGAGGIGDELYTAIRVLYYEDVSAIIILLILTVTAIDSLCARLRHGLIGRESLA